MPTNAKRRMAETSTCPVETEMRNRWAQLATMAYKASHMQKGLDTRLTFSRNLQV